MVVRSCVLQDKNSKTPSDPDMRTSGRGVVGLNFIENPGSLFGIGFPEVFKCGLHHGIATTFYRRVRQTVYEKIIVSVTRAVPMRPFRCQPYLDLCPFG